MDIASALALSRTASFTLVTISSCERSSPIILLPPDTRKTIGTRCFGSTHERCMPRVSMSESQYFTSGSTVFLGFSNFSVGPRKYP